MEAAQIIFTKWTVTHLKAKGRKWRGSGYKNMNCHLETGLCCTLWQVSDFTLSVTYEGSPRLWGGFPSPLPAVRKMPADLSALISVQSESLLRYLEEFWLLFVSVVRSLLSAWYLHFHVVEVWCSCACSVWRLPLPLLSLQPAWLL